MFFVIAPHSALSSVTGVKHAARGPKPAPGGSGPAPGTDLQSAKITLILTIKDVEPVLVQTDQYDRK